MNFDQLFDEVYPQLYRYALRMSGDADLAEDTAQEAFVRLLDRKVEGDEGGLRGWLFTVTTHLLHDRAKVAKNRARLLEAHPVTPEAPQSPDRALERGRSIERVRRALDTLDERDRTVLLMREEGFTYRELAKVIGVQPTSVGTLLARARTRLFDALNGNLDG